MFRRKLFQTQKLCTSKNFQKHFPEIYNRNLYLLTSSSSDIAQAVSRSSVSWYDKPIPNLCKSVTNSLDRVVYVMPQISGSEKNNPNLLIILAFYSRLFSLINSDNAYRYKSIKEHYAKYVRIRVFPDPNIFV